MVNLNNFPIDAWLLLRTCMLVVIGNVNLLFISAVQLLPPPPPPTAWNLGPMNDTSIWLDVLCNCRLGCHKLLKRTQWNRPKSVRVNWGCTKSWLGFLILLNEFHIAIPLNACGFHHTWVLSQFEFIVILKRCCTKMDWKHTR